MPSTTQEFSLRRLADALDRVSDDVRGEVSRLAQIAAGLTRVDVQARYPVGPVHWRAGRQVGGGALRTSVVLGQPGRFSVSAGGRTVPAAVVRVLAPHVHFYEAGTGERFDPTRRNARRGRMTPAGAIFVDTAIRHREGMLASAEALVRQPREIG